MLALTGLVLPKFLVAFIHGKAKFYQFDRVAKLLLARLDIVNTLRNSILMEKIIRKTDIYAFKISKHVNL